MGQSLSLLAVALPVIGYSWGIGAAPTGASTYTNEPPRRDAKALLNCRVRRLRIHNATVEECMMVLGNRLDFTYAVENVPASGITPQSLNKPISIDIVKGLPFGKVLDYIVAQNPIFSWTMTPHGMIRIYPKRSVSAPNYLMLRKIPKFKAERANSNELVEACADAISKTDREIKLRFFGRSPQVDDLGDELLFSIHRLNFTIRELMDLVSAKTNSSWIISYDRQSGQYDIAVGRRFALPIKFADAATALRFGVKLPSASEPIIQIEPGAYANKPSNKLPAIMRKIRRFHVVSATVPECVQLLANRFKFRFAIEALPTSHSHEYKVDEFLKPVSLDLENVVLADVLDALTRANPAYSSSFTGGVCRFFPHWAEFDPAYPLTRPVATFNATGVEAFEAANAWIAEVQKVAEPNKFVNLVATTKRDADGDPILLNQARTNKTGREILDDITARLGESWMIMPTRDHDVFSLDMRTAFPLSKQVQATAIIEADD